MTRGLGRDVAKLLITSLLNGVFVGLWALLVVDFVTFPFRSAGKEEYTLLAFTGCMLFAGGALSALCLTFGVVSLPTARRLTRTFSLEDRWRWNPALARRVERIVDEEEFLRRASDVINRRLPVTDTRLREATWVVELAGLLYSIGVEGFGASDRLVLVVRRRGWLAHLVPARRSRRCRDC